MKIDVSEMPDVMDAVNAILNNHGIVELKNESRNGINIVVVEISRTVKSSRKN